MPNAAALVYDLVILLMGILLTGKKPWLYRLIYLLLALEASAGWLVHSVVSNLPLLASQASLYTSSIVVSAWLVISVTGVYIKLDQENYLVINRFEQKHKHIWKIAFVIWLFSGLVSLQLSSVPAIYAAAMVLLLNAIMLVLLNTMMDESGLSKAFAQYKQHKLILSTFSATSFTLAVRQIYQSNQLAPVIDRPDQILWVLVSILGVYLPLYTWNKYFAQIDTFEKQLKARLDDQLDGLGSLLAMQSEFTGPHANGLVLTDANFEICYVNKIARDLLEDGNNLLKGVKFCRVLGGLSDITPAQLATHKFVMIAPLNSARLNAVEIKRIELPYVYRSAVTAYSLRRVIADPQVLEYIIKQLNRYRNTPWWVVDDAGNIIHTAGIELVPPQIKVELDQCANLLTVLEPRVSDEHSRAHIRTAMHSGVEVAIRWVIAEAVYDQQIHFYPVYVGRSSVKRFLVTMKAVAKAPPLKGTSYVHLQTLEN
jgi:hypothetical protein